MRDTASIHAAFKLQTLLKNQPPQSGKEPYRIFTTLDKALQQQALTAVQQNMARYRDQGADQAALILLDRQNQAVRAWIGSTDYFDTQHAGAIDYTQIKRSPGSTLKPFIYGLAFEQKLITPATVLDDLPTLGGEIRNADRNYLGPLLPRQALANSRNIPVANLLNRMGIDEAYALFETLGLHHNDLPATTYGLGLATGAMPASLESVMTAYSALTQDGLLRTPNWLQQPTTPAAGKRIFDAHTVRSLNLMLSDPVARLPTFPRMGPTEYPFPVALKTGTSQGMRDAWIVAWSAHYVIGVWIGNPDTRPMKEMTGGGSAAAIAQQVLLALHQQQQQGLADLNFAPPAGYVPVTLCTRSGKRATASCDQTLEEWLPPGQVPVDDDDSHVQIAIDARNGLRAHSDTPTQYIQQTNFVNLPPRYAEWAAHNGLRLLPVEASSEGKLSAATHASAPIILSPRNGDKLLRAPSIPAHLSTIALRAEVTGNIKEILWVIDGQPWQLASHPYQTRWPLKPGLHTIEAWVPYTPIKSKAVYVQVE